MDVSTVVEDYLKAIFHLDSRGRATVTQVAATLEVSAPSASVMVKRLEEGGFVERPPSGGIILTPAGLSHAVRIVRRHRLVETFLAEVLDMTWDEVHTEAEVLEHAISEVLEARIDAFLGHPTHDPHGDPIPPPGGRHDESWPSPLLEVEPGVRFVVERVSSEDMEALRYLGTCGIRPGVALNVVRQDPFGGPVWMDVDGDRVGIGREVCELVHGHAGGT